MSEKIPVGALPRTREVLNFVRDVATGKHHGSPDILLAAIKKQSESAVTTEDALNGLKTLGIAFATTPLGAPGGVWTILVLVGAWNESCTIMVVNATDVPLELDGAPLQVHGLMAGSPQTATQPPRENFIPAGTKNWMPFGIWRFEKDLSAVISFVGTMGVLQFKKQGKTLPTGLRVAWEIPFASGKPNSCGLSIDDHEDAKAWYERAIDDKEIASARLSGNGNAKIFCAHGDPGGADSLMVVLVENKKGVPLHGDSAATRSPLAQLGGGAASGAKPQGDYQEPAGGSGASPQDAPPVTRPLAVPAPGEGGGREHDRRPNQNETEMTEREAREIAKGVISEYGRVQDLGIDLEKRSNANAREIRQSLSRSESEDDVLTAPSRLGNQEVRSGIGSGETGVQRACRYSCYGLLMFGGLAFAAMVDVVILTVFNTGEPPDPNLQPTTPAPPDPTDPPDPDPTDPPDPDPTDPPEQGDVTPEFEKLVAKQIDEWNALDEAVFWSTLTQFIITEQPSNFRQRYIALTLGTAATGPTPEEAVVAAGAAEIKAKHELVPGIEAPYIKAGILRFENRDMTRKERLGSLYRFISEEFFPEETT